MVSVVFPDFDTIKKFDEIVKMNTLKKPSNLKRLARVLLAKKNLCRNISFWAHEFLISLFIR